MLPKGFTIFGVMFDKIGLKGLCKSIQHQRIKNVIISRIADSKSKRQTAKLLTEEYKKPNQFYPFYHSHHGYGDDHAHLHHKKSLPLAENNLSLQYVIKRTY